MPRNILFRALIFFHLGALATGTAARLSAPLASASEPISPNIVFILAGDMG